MGLSDISQGTAKRIEIDIKLVSTHDSQRGKVHELRQGQTVKVVSGEVSPKLDICSDGLCLGKVAFLFSRDGCGGRARVIDSSGN